MPIHDWSRVSDGMFHWFHQCWIGTIVTWLNQGRLPEGHYAIGEVYANEVEPDVLAVEDRPPENGRANGRSAQEFGVALLEAPPKRASPGRRRPNRISPRKTSSRCAASREFSSRWSRSSRAATSRARLGFASFSRRRSSFWTKAYMPSS